MAYNGSGAFVLYTPGNPVVSGTIISDTWANNTLNDLATGLSTAITRDGQTTTTARINFAQGLTSTLATDATNTTTGSLLTSGGLGVVKAAWIGGLLNVAGATTLSSALTYGGVTLSNAVTGTGNMVLSASPTFTGTLTAAAITGTTGAFSGIGTFTATGEAIKVTPATTTGLGLISFNNTGGTTYFGTDNSTGSFFGGAAYGIGINAIAGTSIRQIIGSTTISNITSTGLAVTGMLSATSGVIGESYVKASNSIATPAGGASASGIIFGLATTQIIWGSGAPSASVAKGSLYLRTDGSATNNRAYINTDGGTTWTAIITAL